MAVAAKKPSTKRPAYMDSPEIKSLTARYRSRLDPEQKNTLYDETAILGHMDKHVGMTSIEVMDQLLDLTIHPKGTTQSKLPGCTNSFADPASARNDVIEAMYTKASDIAAWRYDSHPYARSHDPLVLHIPMMTEDDFTNPDPDMPMPLPGIAFRQTRDDISACHNTTLVMVLSPLYGSHDDFRLTTAYPMSTSGIEPYAENDTLDIIRQTPTYQKASPFWKTMFEYKGIEKPADRPFMKMSEKQNAIIISCRNPENDPEERRGAGLGAVFMVYDDGKIKYRHERAGEQYKPPVTITKENIAGYAIMYPNQAKLAMTLSERIQQLTKIEFEQNLKQSAKEAALRRQQAKLKTNPVVPAEKPKTPKKKTKRPPAYQTTRKRRQYDETYDILDDESDFTL